MEILRKLRMTTGGGSLSREADTTPLLEVDRVATRGRDGSPSRPRVEVRLAAWENGLSSRSLHHTRTAGDSHPYRAAGATTPRLRR